MKSSSKSQIEQARIPSAAACTTVSEIQTKRATVRPRDDVPACLSERGYAQLAIRSELAAAEGT
jgi:hypothetical protein